MIGYKINCSDAVRPLTNVLNVIPKDQQNLIELSDLAKPEVARMYCASAGVPAGVYAKELYQSEVVGQNRT